MGLPALCYKYKQVTMTLFGNFCLKKLKRVFSQNYYQNIRWQTLFCVWYILVQVIAGIIICICFRFLKAAVTLRNLYSNEGTKLVFYGFLWVSQFSVGNLSFRYSLTKLHYIRVNQKYILPWRLFTSYWKFPSPRLWEI